MSASLTTVTSIAIVSAINATLGAQVGPAAAADIAAGHAWSVVAMAPPEIIADPAAPTFRAVVLRRDLVKVLAIAARIVPNKSPHAAIRSVKIGMGRIGHDSISIAATNLETHFQANLGSAAQVDQVGPDFLVDAKLIWKACRGMKETQVIMECTPAGLQIRGDRNTVTLAYSAPAADFPPAWPMHTAGAPTWEPLAEKITTMHRIDSAAQFAAAVNRVSYAVAREVSRYAFNGINLEFGAAGIDLVATDTRRLATCALPGRYEKTAAILPAESMRILVDTIAAAAGRPGSAMDDLQTMTCETSETRHRFTINSGTDDFTITCAIIEGQFAPWREVIPKAADSRLYANAAELRAAVIAGGAAVSPEKPGAVFTLTPGRGVKISACGENTGGSESFLPARYDQVDEQSYDLPAAAGKPAIVSVRKRKQTAAQVAADVAAAAAAAAGMRREIQNDLVELVIGLNPSFVSEALEVLAKDHECIVSFQKPNRPILVECASAGYRAVIMPVNLQQ